MMLEKILCVFVGYLIGIAVWYFIDWVECRYLQNIAKEVTDD